MSLYIIDTNTDADIKINDALVHKSLALAYKDNLKDEAGEEVYFLDTFNAVCFLIQVHVRGCFLSYLMYLC